MLWANRSACTFMRWPGCAIRAGSTRRAAAGRSALRRAGTRPRSPKTRPHPDADHRSARRRLRGRDRVCRLVVLRLRYGDFVKATHSRTVASDGPTAVLSPSREALRAADITEIAERGITLIGVRCRTGARRSIETESPIDWNDGVPRHGARRSARSLRRGVGIRPRSWVAIRAGRLGAAGTRVTAGKCVTTAVPALPSSKARRPEVGSGCGRRCFVDAP